MPDASQQTEINAAMMESKTAGSIQQMMEYIWTQNQEPDKDNLWRHNVCILHHQGYWWTWEAQYAKWHRLIYTM